MLHSTSNVPGPKRTPVPFKAPFGSDPMKPMVEGHRPPMVPRRTAKAPMVPRRTAGEPTNVFPNTSRVSVSRAPMVPTTTRNMFPRRSEINVHVAPMVPTNVFPNTSTVNVPGAQMTPTNMLPKRSEVNVPGAPIRAFPRSPTDYFFPDHKRPRSMILQKLMFLPLTCDI